MADMAASFQEAVVEVIVNKAISAAREFGQNRIVMAGGVASNSLLRQVLAPLNPIFAQPQYSTDNAMGVAVLTHRAMEV